MSLKRTQPENVAQLAVAGVASAFAVVVGVIAVGRHFGRKLSLRDARADHMSIDDLADGRPRAREFVRDDISPPPIR